MDRHSLNYFSNALLGLAPYGPSARKLLIEEGAAAVDLHELLEEWLWTYNLRESDILKIKIWLGLNAKDLAAVFRRNPRDIAQLLRNQRVALLPAYPPLDRAHETTQIAGLSCFMVEQYLSAWTDQELAEIKVAEALVTHTRECLPCRERLNEYRILQEQILSQRPSYPAIDENEWSRVLEEVRVSARKQLRRILTVILLIVGVVVVLAWVFLSKPEKIPNVYELPESREN